MSDSPAIHYADLPDASLLLDRSARAKCISLFKEMESLVISVETLTDRMDEIKAELVTYQDTLDAPGIRYGGWAYIHRTAKGRRSLNRDLLMENGVSKAVLDASMKTGEPYSQHTFKRVKEGEEF